MHRPAPRARRSSCAALAGLVPQLSRPGLCCCALSALGFVFSSLEAHSQQSRSKKYGHEKKSKIRHFCSRKLLKPLGRFFAKSIFSHDLCGIRRDAGAPAFRAGDCRNCMKADLSCKHPPRTAALESCSTCLNSKLLGVALAAVCE